MIFSRRSVEAPDWPGSPTRARFLRVVGWRSGSGFFRACENRGPHSSRALAPGFRTSHRVIYQVFMKPALLTTVFLTQFSSSFHLAFARLLSNPFGHKYR